MRIIIPDERLRKLLNLEGRMKAKMGAQTRKKIMLRMQQLLTCNVLDDMRHYPPAHIEELRHYPGKHYFTVRLEGPERIVFEPANDPVPLLAGGNVDWTQVTAIRILEVGDPHGK